MGYAAASLSKRLPALIGMPHVLRNGAVTCSAAALGGRAGP